MSEPNPPQQPVAEPTPVPTPRARWWRSWKLWLATLLLAPILLFVIYTVSALNWSYSEGIRAGYLQKFSKKGWFCKTWEGELAQSIVPNVAPTIWTFTVRKETTARQLNLVLGRRVMLFYREHRGIPSHCFGDTNYFVDSVRIVQ
jgi:hypothetical protein